MKRFENVDSALCREMEKLDRKYGSSDSELSQQDLETIRLLYSAMTKAQTYYAMKEADEWEEKEASGRSYRRGRDAMGRYVSRDMGIHDGDYSGHYPDWRPMYRY